MTPLEIILAVLLATTWTLIAVAWLVERSNMRYFARLSNQWDPELLTNAETKILKSREPLTEAGYEALAAEWKRKYGGGRAHEVRIIDREEQPDA